MSSASLDIVPPLRMALLQSNLRSGEYYSLRKTVILIGRSAIGSDDIRLPHDDLHASREHARLVFEEDAWFLEDHSYNGTLVNGYLLHKAKVKLQNGDRIRIGNSFDVTFYYLERTAPAHVTDPTNADNGRLAPPAELPPTQVGLWISPSAAVWRDGQQLPEPLSRTEYRLVKYLMQYPNQICEYPAVIHAVWGDQRNRDSLHELIYRVRRKIEPIPQQPRYLIIRGGLGVVLFPQGTGSE
ncbi:MAG: FHA domain-containing protein [Thermoflexales bacterium]|nr:FHA domain-containing protein [Thermoflexales bacterium]